MAGAALARWKPRLPGPFCLLLLLAVAASGRLEAVPCNPGCTVCWKQPVSGSWYEDSNWNSGRVPVADDVVCIDREGSYTVTAAGGSITVAGLTVGSCSGLAVLALDGAELDLEGDGDVECGGQLEVTGGAVHTPAGGTLHNRGNLVVDGASLAVGLDNLGLVEAGGSAVTALDAGGGEVLNQGGATIRVRRGRLELRGAATFTNRGALEIGAGSPAPLAMAAVMVMSGGRLDPDGGAVTGLGTLRLDGVTVLGDLTLEDRSLSVELLDAAMPPGARIDNHSRLVVEGELHVGGDVVNHPGGQLVLEGSQALGDARLLVGSSFSNAGTLRLDNTDGRPREATIEVPGEAIDNRVDGVIVVAAGGGGARRLVGGLRNSGRVLVTGGLLEVEGGEFSNAATGAIEAQGGELVLLLNPSGVGKAGPQFTNSGQVALSSGTRVRIRGTSGRPVARGGGGTTSKASALFVNAGSILTAVDSELSVAGLGFENAPGGTLAGNGRFDFSEATEALNRGRLTPGLSPGLLTVVGALAQSATALTELEVGGRTRGVDYDRLQVSGALGLAGSLAVSLVGGFQPEVGDRFDVLGFASASGELDGADLPALTRSLEWELVREPTSLSLAVLCGGPQLGLAVAPDKDPVSLGFKLLHQVVIDNSSTVAATGVTLELPLPQDLRFLPASSSAECFYSGGEVRCRLEQVPAHRQRELVVGVEPLQPGRLVSLFRLSQEECVPAPEGYLDAVQVRVTSARPCDADADGWVTASDLPAAVGSIFGDEVEGNPDCRLGGGIDAADLAAIAARVGSGHPLRPGARSRVSPG